MAAPAYFGPAQGPLDGAKFAYFLDLDGNVIEILEDLRQKFLLGRVGLSNLEKTKLEEEKSSRFWSRAFDFARDI